MLHIFFSWVFSVINHSSPSSSSQHIFAPRQFFFLIQENTEDTQKKTARTIPSDILAFLSFFFHSHSLFILLPQAPTLFFPIFPPRFSLAVRFSPPSVGWWHVPPARR